MRSNLVLVGWNNAVAGREHDSAQHFDDFTAYLGGLQRRGTIQSFEIVLLDAHGGDLNGFILVKGQPARLDALLSTHDWIVHTTRASLHLSGFGVVRGVAGDGVPERISLWKKLLPDSGIRS